MELFCKINVSTTDGAHVISYLQKINYDVNQKNAVIAALKDRLRRVCNLPHNCNTITFEYRGPSSLNCRLAVRDYKDFEGIVKALCLRETAFNTLPLVELHAKIDPMTVKNASEAAVQSYANNPSLCQFQCPHLTGQSSLNAQNAQAENCFAGRMFQELQTNSAELKNLTQKVDKMLSMIGNLKSVPSEMKELEVAVKSIENNLSARVMTVEQAVKNSRSSCEKVVNVVKDQLECKEMETTMVYTAERANLTMGSSNKPFNQPSNTSRSNTNSDDGNTRSHGTNELHETGKPQPTCRPSSPDKQFLSEKQLEMEHSGAEKETHQENIGEDDELFILVEEVEDVVSLNSSQSASEEGAPDPVNTSKFDAVPHKGCAYPGSLKLMQSLGFTDEGGWLSRLIEVKGGCVYQALHTIGANNHVTITRCKGSTCECA